MNYNYKEANINERGLLDNLIQLIKPTYYFPTSIQSTAKFDAVIKNNNKIYIVEVKTRTTVETNCLIEQYKYNNLMHICKEGDAECLFITIDADGYWIANLNKIDIEAYFKQEMGWKTNNHKINNEPKELLNRYYIPKVLMKHIQPTNKKIDKDKIINNDIEYERLRYLNDFGMYQSDFLSKVNELLNIYCKKRLN